MFGLARLRTGSVMGVALTICLILVRIFLVRYYTLHGEHAAMPESGGYALVQAADTAAPVSAWLIFATTDRDTQLRTEHARLRAEPPSDDRLELRAVARGQGDALVLLDSLPQAGCSAIGHVAASFDGRKAEMYDAEASWADTMCSVKIGGYERFVQGLLNAQTVAVVPKAPGTTLPEANFHVAGLTWQTE